MIVGLGNPGGNYDNTRHNIGFMVVDELASQFDINTKKLEKSAAVGKGMIAGKEVLLVKPVGGLRWVARPSCMHTPVQTRVHALRSACTVWSSLPVRARTHTHEHTHTCSMARTHAAWLAHMNPS